MSATRCAVAAVLLLLAASAACAAERGGSFRLWGHGARDLALGGASTLGAPGVESLFDQPASLVGLDAWEAGLSARRPTGGPEILLSSAVVGLGSGHRATLRDERIASSRLAAAVAFQHLGATLADDSGWGEWTLSAGGAWSPLRWLSLGLRADNARGGSEDGMDSGSAFAVSAGLRAVVLHPGFELGWVAEDLYHRFSLEGGETRNRAPANSLAARAELPAGLAAETLLRWRFGAAERWAIGVEWGPWRERLLLRGGLIRFMLAESRWAPSLGAGLALGALHVDYGFRADAEEGPGSQHRVSLRWAGDPR